MGVALKRISELESRPTKPVTQTNLVPCKQEERLIKKDEFSPLLFSSDTTSVVSPVLTPIPSTATSPIAFDLSDSSCSYQNEFGNRYQHINMISRQPAVKITDADVSNLTSLGNANVSLPSATQDCYVDEEEFGNFLLDTLAPEYLQHSCNSNTNSRNDGRSIIAEHN